MKDYQASLEKLRKDAAEAVALRADITSSPRHGASHQRYVIALSQSDGTFNRVGLQSAIP